MPALFSDVGPFDALTDRWLIEALSQMSSNPRVRCAAAAWLAARRSALELGLGGDQLLREGLQPEVRLPAIPGYDAVGVVVATGTGVVDVSVGAHVAVWTGGSGGYATHITVPAWDVVEYPAELRPDVVASSILNYLTAYQLLIRAAPVADGTTILVHPAGGGVGSALLQLGALRGLRMFGTASAARARLIADLGAEPIDYRTQDVAERVRAEAPDGIDAIFDGIGGSSWGKELSLLRPGGHLALYGVTEGIQNGRRSLPALLASAIRAPRTSYLTYFTRRVGVTGYRIDATIGAHLDWYRTDLQALLRLVQDGRLTPAIHRTFPSIRPPKPTRYWEPAELLARSCSHLANPDRAWSCWNTADGRGTLRYAEPNIEDTMGQSVTTQLSDSVRKLSMVSPGCLCATPTIVRHER